MSNGLAAPGSSTYDSNTLHVGDGTWDSNRETFLLPNLMGLNFATMQYNGMRNRFRDLAEYHNLIAAHGIMAAMVFLFMIPFAIFMAKWYHRNPRLALRLHIWTQILVFFFVTVVFVLGWFAVGPERSLTNPHHGIGLALYVMITFQILYGSWVHHVEKKKNRYKLPVKLMLHQWLGRAIALLGIAQIPLGLTLYGSPKSLFILYAVWVFILLLIYFIFSYRYQTTVAIDDRGTYYTGTGTDLTSESSPSRHGRFGKIAAGLGAAGLAAAVMKRRRSRSRSRSRTRTDGVSSHQSESYVDEKYSPDGRKQHTWRNRLFAGAAGVGAVAAARRLFGGRRHDSDESMVSDYPHRPLGGAQSYTETDVSRIEEGRRPTTPTRTSGAAAVLPAAAAAAALSPGRHSRPDYRPSGASIHSYDSYSSYTDSPGKTKRETHTLRDAIAVLGVAGGLRHMWDKRKQQRDEARVAEMRRRDREAERLARRNSGKGRYTGDGIPRPPHRRHSSIGESEMSPLGGSNPELSLHNLSRPGAPTTPDVTAANTAANAGISLPPPPPLPVGSRRDSSGSEAYTSPSGGRRHRHHGSAGAAAAGLAAGTAAGAAAGRRRTSSHRRESSDSASAHSPRASVQVKMHNDGRRVTLRRLDANERAAERARRSQNRPSNAPAGSIISSANGASGDEHWRRVERLEAQQAAQMRADAIAAGEQQHNIPPPQPPMFAAPPIVPLHSATISPVASDLPPPPPIPAAGSAMGGGSPGSVYGSGPSNVDSRAESNRRRRRAERARMEQMAREGRGGGRVDFT